MTTTPYEEFTDDGVRKADAELKKHIKSILHTYALLYAAMADLVRDFYNDYTDRDRAIYKTLFTWAVATGRHKRLESDMRKLYEEYMEDVKESLLSYMEAVSKDSYDRMRYAMLWKHPSMPLDAIPQELLDLAVLGTDDAYRQYMSSPYVTTYGDPSLWMPKHGDMESIINGNHAESLSAIMTALHLSITSGSGVTATLRSLKEATGKVVKVKNKATGEEKTKVRGAAAKEVRMLRTEGNRLMNVGILASALALSAMENSPVLTKMWVSILDSRTRQQSVDMNGQVRQLDEPYVFPNGATGMYPGDSGVPAYDINCRCTSVTVDGDDDGNSRGVNPYTGDTAKYTWNDYASWLDSEY